MIPGSHEADLVRCSSTLDAIMRDAQQADCPPHELIAETLRMNPNAVKDILEMIAVRSKEGGLYPTLIATQVGMSFGARQARANADNERLAA